MVLETGNGLPRVPTLFATHEKLSRLREVLGNFKDYNIKELLAKVIAVLGVYVPHERKICLPLATGGNIKLYCISDDGIDAILEGRVSKIPIIEKLVVPLESDSEKLVLADVESFERILIGSLPKALVFQRTPDDEVVVNRKMYSMRTVARAALTCVERDWCGFEEYVRILHETSDEEDEEVLKHNYELFKREGFVVELDDVKLILRYNDEETRQRARKLYEYYVRTLKKHDEKIRVAQALVETIYESGDEDYLRYYLKGGGSPEVKVVRVSERKNPGRDSRFIISDNAIIYGAVIIADKLDVQEEESNDDGIPPEYENIASKIISILRDAGYDRNLRVVSWREAALRAGSDYIKVTLDDYAKYTAVYGVLTDNFFVPINAPLYIVEPHGGAPLYVNKYTYYYDMFDYVSESYIKISVVRRGEKLSGGHLAFAFWTLYEARDNRYYDILHFLDYVGEMASVVPFEKAESVLDFLNDISIKVRYMKPSRLIV